MTTAEFKKMMNVWGDDFYDATCDKLAAEIVRKIMNCKAVGDFEKMTMLRQYMNGLVTNGCVVDAIKQYNNR